MATRGGGKGDNMLTYKSGETVNCELRIEFFDGLVICIFSGHLLTGMVQGGWKSRNDLKQC